MRASYNPSMEQIRQDLWLASFDRTGGVNSCGFLLLRPEGNVLFYSAPNEADFERIADLGGIEHQILSHRHETDPSPDTVKKAFGTRLCSDALEGPVISKESQVDLTLDAEDSGLESIEVLHTPGHTKGGISCIYRSPHGEVYLFSGDTMIPVNGQWIAQIVPEHGGDATVLTRSLLRLRDLEPDLVLSSASVGEHTAVEVEHDQWFRAVEETAGRPPIVSG